MVLPPTDNAVILGLMDEPFRGTNSEEQVAASLAVVEHLLSSSSFFLVATHEQRLTEFAAAHGSATNRHFEERLEEEGLVFDYRLQDGPARTRNALNVLEREGYPDELVARARSMFRGTASTPS